MDQFACSLIDALGGNGAVARMTKAPAQTVHGWRKVGLSQARLDHLLLAAERDGKADAASEVLKRFGVNHDASDTAGVDASDSGSAESFATRAGAAA